MKFSRLSFICLSLLIAAGCKPEAPSSPKLSPGSGSTQPPPGTPRYWKASKFPLNVYISEDFETDFNGYYDPLNERNPIEKIQEKWDADVPSTDFFNLDLGYVPNREYATTEEFSDNQIGIYKSYTWFDDVSSNAIAVQAHRIIRRNVGTPYEYSEILHSDIILNYSNYTFTMDPNNDSDFDLPTVVGHELGHLLGLGHIDFGEAVMNSFLRSNEVKRDLFSLDSNAIQDLYNETSSGSGSGSSALVPSFSTSGPPHPQEGEIVRGIIELMPDGTCRHYLDGQLTHEHQRP